MRFLVWFRVSGINWVESLYVKGRPANEERHHNGNWNRKEVGCILKQIAYYSIFYFDLNFQLFLFKFAKYDYLMIDGFINYNSNQKIKKNIAQIVRAL